MENKYSGLTLKNADVGYHKDQPVMKDVKLELDYAKRYRLIGPNGSGKTTLIRTILGLLPVLSGERAVQFGSIGYVPQVKVVDRQFPITVHDGLLLSFPGWNSIIKKKLRDKKHSIIERSLSLTGLTDKQNKMISQCSGGELQRFLIARALCIEPDFLVLDEPLSSVDIQGKKEISAILEKLYSEGSISFLYTSHEADHSGYPGEILLSIENQTLMQKMRSHHHS